MKGVSRGYRGESLPCKGGKNDLPHVGEDEEVSVAHRIKAEILKLAFKAFLNLVADNF